MIQGRSRLREPLPGAVQLLERVASLGEHGLGAQNGGSGGGPGVPVVLRGEFGLHFFECVQLQHAAQSLRDIEARPGNK